MWITLDSVRYDRTSLCNYDRDTTPVLRRLKNNKNTISYDTCFSHGTRTPISVPSILTGTYPRYHSVGIRNDHLPDEINLVPELLSDIGYETVGVSDNAYAGTGTGVQRGFDEYIHPRLRGLREPYRISTILKYAMNVRSQGPGFTLDNHKPFTYMTVSTAKRKLTSLSNGTSPFFFYLHLNEVHRPYVPPKVYRTKYADDFKMSLPQAIDLCLDIHRNTFEYIADGLPFSDEEWAVLNALYDSEITYVDSQVKRLYDHIRRLGLDDTIVVITSDHGEVLGEHGLIGHQISLHDAVTRVPMIILGDITPKLVSGLVQHVDVMKTLLSYVGANTDGLHGYELTTEHRPYAIAQERKDITDNLLEHDPECRVSDFPNDLRTRLRTETYKLVRSSSESWLYSLTDESTDISDYDPERVETYQSELDGWERDIEDPFDSLDPQGHSDDVRQRLEYMGYLR